MPIYEFSCGSCGERFEELVGSHVGLSVDRVRCPECGSEQAERLISGSHAPPQRAMTANQKRRSEAARGIDRGGAKERFKHQRAAERERSRGR